MTLCDIGNTTATFYIDGAIQSIPVNALEALTTERVYYISVNSSVSKMLSTHSNWVNIEHLLDKPMFYDGMGVDRRALCCAIHHGVMVDAGSAVTIDVMRSGVYEGGLIMQGKHAAQKSLAGISARLVSSFDIQNKCAKLARNTEEALTLGYYLPIVETIRSFQLPIYLCGGDGKSLKQFLDEATMDETLLFQGMLNVLSEELC